MYDSLTMRLTQACNNDPQAFMTELVRDYFPKIVLPIQRSQFNLETKMLETNKKEHYTDYWVQMFFYLHPQLAAWMMMKATQEDLFNYLQAGAENICAQDLFNERVTISMTEKNNGVAEGYLFSIYWRIGI